MKVAFPVHQFGTIGPAALEERVLALSESQLFGLLGPAATADDSRNLHMEEVRDLVEAVMTSIDDEAMEPREIKPVPVDKLSFNKLPQHWHDLLVAASQNAPYVKQYFDHHPNPEAGNAVALAFRQRYEALRQENLGPGTIMDQLYEQTTGVGAVTARRQVATQALLAYLFDACEIFEDQASKVSS
jgi:hypothetical protein